MLTVQTAKVKVRIESDEPWGQNEAGLGQCDVDVVSMDVAIILS